MNFGVANKGSALQSLLSVWGLLCICEVQGAKCLCVSSKRFARDHEKLPFSLPWNMFLALKYFKSYHPGK